MTLMDKSIQLSDVQKAFSSGSAAAQVAFQSSVSQVSSVSGKTGSVTLAKADVGLGNVDNTSDVNKPVSAAQATAIGAKMDATLPALQAVVDSGTPAQKAALSASVSGDGVSPLLSASGNLVSPGVGQNGRIVCDWSADLGVLLITAGTGTAALDSSVMIDGRPALRYTPGAATETGVARYTLTTPCRIQDIRSIQIPVRHTAQVGTTVSGTGNATANIQIWLITSANKQFRLYLRDAGVIAGGDTVYTWSPRETTDTYVLSGGAVWMQADGSALCSAENETVTQFQVVHFSSVQSAAFPIWLGPVYVNRRASHGVVSLRFDKCTASQYSIAWPIMKQYGVRATLALLSNAINTPGYLTTAQIDEMVAGGCDVALHTHTTTKTNGYANATDWPSADLIAQDITAGVKILRTSGWRWAQGLLIEGFTGGYTTGDIVRQRLIRSAFNNTGMPVLSTMQGVSGTYRQQNYIGPKIAGVVQRRIQCQQTLAANTVVSAVTDGVAQAAADGTLMGILAHDFVANSATPTGNEIRAGDFETICAAIKSSGALSLPMGDVLRHMY